MSYRCKKDANLNKDQQIVSLVIFKRYRHLCVGELHNIQVIQPERHRCAYRWLNEAICSVITNQKE